MILSTRLKIYLFIHPRLQSNLRPFTNPSTTRFLSHSQPSFLPSSFSLSAFVHLNTFPPHFLLDYLSVNKPAHFYFLDQLVFSQQGRKSPGYYPSHIPASPLISFIYQPGLSQPAAAILLKQKIPVKLILIR